MEALIATLQHLDTVGKGLYDLVFEQDVLNPFYTCRHRIATLVTDGASGAMAPIFARLPERWHAEVLADVRCMGLDLGGQIWRRFLEYSDFPYQFARLVHPAVSEEDKTALTESFSSMKACCLDRKFSLKVVSAR